MKFKSALLFFVLCASGAVTFAGTVKNLTVNDYLQQARAQGKEANRLINESSPYLLQHAYNPVDWYAWGDEAFNKAKKENKPIFLSIGYSTCHWCHVMAHESFDNKEIAALLNKYFICIKVDREQRPDIDSVYMSATQLINGQGGWPMTVFLDHDLRPFHAATYYPPFSVGDRKGLNEVLLKVHELWLAQPELINQVATNITSRITDLANETSENGSLVANINELALQDIRQSYEEDFGGFSVAPKFPRPGIFSFLNKLVSSRNKAVAAEDKIIAQKMMETTLDAMLSGGIYDQLAGGFHRYSVDDRWQVPHFEKMLYSQALMVMAYNDFYKIDARSKYQQVILETLTFVSREMRSPDGGFYSALDADSEPVDGKGGNKAEGAYYLWHQSELEKALSAAELEFAKKYFQQRENGNIYSDPYDEFTKLNILFIDEDFRVVELTSQEQKWLASIKRKLSEARLKRPRPHLDDKIITAWNGMMVSAFAESSVIFKDRQLLLQAKQTANFIESNLYDKKSGKLYRLYRSQINIAAASTQATLSDYAWLIQGLLAIYDASSEEKWLNWAFDLLKKQDELFLDDDSGAYFESVASDNSLLFRSKTIYDDALPSANAIALSNLRSLSVLADEPTEKKRLSSQADSLVSSFALAVNQKPSAAAMLLAIELEQVGKKHIDAKQSLSVLQ